MKRFSLSGFQLKYIALITMVFDHIQYFLNIQENTHLVYYDWEISGPLISICCD